MSQDLFDRQIRLFGELAQDRLRSLRVAIVGLGGTGSIVCQELVHLGVRDFLLIDADVVEASNLNRIANASIADVDQAKVSVAAKYIQSYDSTALVNPVRGDVMQKDVANELIAADFIFLCTDSHGSRAVVQQVSYQYLIPCIDMGVVIAVNGGRVNHIYGRVQLLAPGLACLTCSGLLNSDEVRRDMMTKLERKSDPYIQGAREPAPAVMSLNGTVSSLAVTMMLAVVAAVPVNGRHILYNAIASTLRNVRAQPAPDCFICSRSGALARGNSWPLFAREN
jgi:molybdopterin/thiamine biosynthesis adenylyltransferase